MHILHLNQRNQILFQYLRDKKKERKKGAQKKGGENSPISPPLDPPLSRSAARGNRQFEIHLIEFSFPTTSFPITDYNTNPKIRRLLICCRCLAQATRRGVSDKWELSFETGCQ